MNPEPSPKTDTAIVAYVAKLKNDDDRGTLALLRGALVDTPEKQQRAWRVLARFGGIPDRDPHTAEVVRTVAGLLALPKMSHTKNGKNFGQICLRLTGDDERKSLHKSDQPGPVSRRVQHLLAASRSEICDRVRQLGRRLEQDECSLDFSQLYGDLFYWGDRVKARWALAFWGVEAEAGPETESAGVIESKEAQP
jgi:CRISPR type I-E-associated protein CasB/Cse2